jgi:hypothetical protein
MENYTDEDFVQIRLVKSPPTESIKMSFVYSACEKHIFFKGRL